VNLKHILNIKKIPNITLHFQKYLDFSKTRFDEIITKLKKYTKKLGLEFKNEVFIPVSAHKEDNIFNQSTKMSWYKGKQFFQVMDELKPLKKSKSKILFRMPIDKITNPEI